MKPGEMSDSDDKFRKITENARKFIIEKLNFKIL